MTVDGGYGARRSTDAPVCPGSLLLLSDDTEPRRRTGVAIGWGCHRGITSSTVVPELSGFGRRCGSGEGKQNEKVLAGKIEKCGKAMLTLWTGRWPMEQRLTYPVRSGT
jgi:hypothetical protein